MAKFKYSAIDQAGKQKKGSIDAANDADARTKLSGMGLMVTSLVAAGGKSSPKKEKQESAAPQAATRKKSSFSIGKPINAEGLSIFTRQLATLLQAGMPLLRSLETMIRQEKRPAFKDILISLADNVRSGNNLSDGLAQYPRVFDRLYVNMVRAGEASGVLDVVLARLSSFQEKSVRTKKKVASAMIYPVVVVFVAVVIVAALLVFVVPKFKEIFETTLQGKALPMPTQVLMNVADILKENTIPAIVVLIIAGIGVKVALGTRGGKKFKDRFVLMVPKIGDLVRKAGISRFSRTFGTLMASGVPILEALKITRETIGNTVIEDALDKVHDRVRDGEPVAAPLEQQRVFPTMVTSMIDVGEETGQLSEMLNRIADNYDEDVDNAVAGITSIIEPIMIVFLAVVVGYIVIALFLPILSIFETMAS